MGNSTSISQFRGPAFNTTVPGLQEDFISVPIIAWSVFVFQCLWALLCFVLLFWRRNAPYTRQRSPLVLGLQLLAQTIYILMNCVRFGIGRSVFPCFLYSPQWFAIEPAGGLPIILRGLRLFVVYRLSLNKELSATLLLKYRNKKKKKDRSNSVTPGNESSSQSQTAPSITATGMTETAATDTSGNEAESAEQRVLIAKRMRKLKFMSVLVSTPFMIAVFVVVYLIHAALWLAITGATDPVKYFVNGFSSGCSLGAELIMLVAMIVQLAFYITGIAIVIIMLFFVRDTWRIRQELFGVLLCLLAGIVPYCICFFVPVFSDLVDYYTPYFYLLMIPFLGDNILSILVPSIISVVRERRAKTTEQDIEIAVATKDQLQFVLHHRPLKDAFKDYSARSFAVEPVLAWDEINRYQRAKTAQKRHTIGRLLIERFVDDGSPFELNLTAKLKRENWMQKLEKSDAEPNLFEPLRQHVEIDMHDNLSRFVHTAQYRQLKDKIQKDQEMKEKTSAMI